MLKRIGQMAAVVALLIGGAVGVSAAVSNDAAAEKTPDAAQAAPAPEVDGQLEVSALGGDAVCGPSEPSDEELAEINAETDALVEYLRDRDYEATVETDEYGVRYPVFDEDADGIFEALDEFYKAQFGEEVASWSEEEKEQWNADVDAMVADLAAEGITVETEEIAPGVRDIVWTDEAGAAFFGPVDPTGEFDAVLSGPNDRTDEFSVVVSGPIDLTGEFDAVFSGPIDLTGEFSAAFSGPINLTGEFSAVVSGPFELSDEDLADGIDDPFCGPFELPDEELAEINAETDALVEYLRDRGYDVTVETDESGVRYPVLDEDADGVFEALDEFFMARFREEVASWSDEEKAQWNADIDALVAELAAEGITVETEEIAPGVYDVVWTDEIGAFFGPDECWDEELSNELEAPFCGPFELSDEELAEMNGETDALVEYLRDRGYDVTVETDEYGARHPVFDEDADGIFEALDEFFMEQFGPDAYEQIQPAVAN